MVWNVQAPIWAPNPLCPSRGLSLRPHSPYVVPAESALSCACVRVEKGRGMRGVWVQGTCEERGLAISRALHPVMHMQTHAHTTPGWHAPC